jgi:hypothetical protein
VLSSRAGHSDPLASNASRYRQQPQGDNPMPTTRRLSAVLFLAALLLSACARGQAADPTATAAPAIAPTATT